MSLNCGMSYTLPFGFFFGRLKMLLQHFVQTWRMASVTHRRRYRREKKAFGDNTYPKKQPKGFLTFVWEACHDTTLIILMVAAVVSLATSMWADGVKDGWYDGTAIAFAVLLVITVTGKRVHIFLCLH
jgi:magnesium-transporting ATPase (P-type)